LTDGKAPASTLNYDPNDEETTLDIKIMAATNRTYFQMTKMDATKMKAPRGPP
jgi:hypothetical protein